MNAAVYFLQWNTKWRSFLYSGSYFFLFIHFNSSTFLSPTEVTIILIFKNIWMNIWLCISNTSCFWDTNSLSQLPSEIHPLKDYFNLPTVPTLPLHFSATSQQILLLFSPTSLSLRDSLYPWDLSLIFCKICFFSVNASVPSHFAKAHH